jgi:hypothetical protein
MYGYYTHSYWLNNSQLGGVLPPPLDTYTGAKVAYSLRQLRTAYAGSAIRVREAGGGTEADIGFDVDGNFDTAALETHCGANNGYVVTWYDQSGNGIDATNATAAAQPLICTAGVTEVDPVNGKPAVYYDGIDDSLKWTGFLTVSLYYYTAVFNRPTSGIKTIGMARHNAYGATGLYWNNGNTIQTLFAVTPFSNHATSQTQTGTFLFTTLRDSSNDCKAWLNSSALTTQNLANDVAYLSSIGEAHLYFNTGHTQEHIYYEADKESDRAALDSNLTAYYLV